MRDCAHCGKAFTPKPANVRQGFGAYCSRSCARRAYQAQRPRRARYHNLTRPGHPLARQDKVPEHRLVLYEKIGPGPHPCHWCSKPVDWMLLAVHELGREGELTVDHLDDDGWNNAPDNLVPSCRGCNANRPRRAA